MALYEDITHSFVIKIWLEQSVEEAGEAAWRGHITHVTSGARRYFETLGDIETFVRPYLRQMGAGLDEVESNGD